MDCKARKISMDSMDRLSSTWRYARACARRAAGKLLQLLRILERVAPVSLTKISLGGWGQCWGSVDPPLTIPVLAIYFKVFRDSGKLSRDVLQRALLPNNVIPDQNSEDFSSRASTRKICPK